MTANIEISIMDSTVRNNRENKCDKCAASNIYSHLSCAAEVSDNNVQA